MAHVVLGEQDRALVGPELLADERRHPELLLDPDRHGLAERAERPREGGDVGGEHPLELQERLVVEADGVELLGADAGLPQDVLDGAGGEAGVVLLAREALFLAGRHDHAVLQEGGRGVVVVGADAEDVFAQNWCLAAARGPSGLGSWARQNDGSGASRRSSRSLRASFMKTADHGDGDEVHDGQDDRAPEGPEALEDGRPPRDRAASRGRTRRRISSTTNTWWPRRAGPACRWEDRRTSGPPGPSTSSTFTRGANPLKTNRNHRCCGRSGSRRLVGWSSWNGWRPPAAATHPDAPARSRPRPARGEGGGGAHHRQRVRHPRGRPEAGASWSWSALPPRWPGRAWPPASRWASRSRRRPCSRSTCPTGPGGPWWRSSATPSGS